MCAATVTAEPTTAPFTIVVDSREQLPFGFDGLKADAKDKHAPLLVNTAVMGLQAGDYGLLDEETGQPRDDVAIERKSFADAHSTFSHGRERFERELERLNQMTFAAVVIEASWHDLMYAAPPNTKGMAPKSLVRSIIAWSVRFPRVHWLPMGNRKLAEAMTFRLLHRFWLEHVKESK
jgi:ERCC4-type nuclease